VRAWVKQGLVDYLVPASPTRLISMDMPIDEWMELVKGTPVEVHPSPDSACPRGNNQATLEMYRAAASNYYAMGADGFYLFNLFCQGFPLETQQYMIIRDVSCPEALSRRTKRFMATGERWHNLAPAAPAKPDGKNSPASIALWVEADPVKLTGSDSTARIGIWIGDDLAAARADNTFKRASLQVRLDRVEPDDRLEISLNGTNLDMSRARIHVPTQRDTINFSSSAGTRERMILGSNPGIPYELQLADVLPHVGNNVIAVRRVRPQASVDQGDSQVVNVDLLVSYSYCGADPDRPD
jgi:hypothetical protein